MAVGDFVTLDSIIENFLAAGYNDFYKTQYWSAFKDGSSNSPSGWKYFYIDAPYWQFNLYTKGSNGSSGAQIDIDMGSYNPLTGNWTTYDRMTCAANNSSSTKSFNSKSYSKTSSLWRFAIRCWGFSAWFGSYSCDTNLLIGGLRNFNADEFPTGQLIGYSDCNFYTATNNFGDVDTFLAAHNPSIKRGSPILAGEHRFAVVPS